jgi:hypothetical protein
MKQCELIKNESLPLNFDARESRPEYANVCAKSDCDSCWAHGSTDALNEKARIKSEFAFQSLLSVADTTACYNIYACFTFKCDVGQVASPCDWFKKKGFVSGGSYGQDYFYYDCFTPMCAHHHIEFTTLLPCDQLTTVAPFFGNSCPSNKSTDHASDKVKSMSSYGVGPTTCDTIKKKIFTFDCVIAEFTI